MNEKNSETSQFTNTLSTLHYRIVPGIAWKILRKSSPEFSILKSTFALKFLHLKLSTSHFVGGRVSCRVLFNFNIKMIWLLADDIGIFMNRLIGYGMDKNVISRMLQDVVMTYVRHTYVGLMRLRTIALVMTMKNHWRDSISMALRSAATARKLGFYMRSASLLVQHALHFFPLILSVTGTLICPCTDFNPC